MTQGVIRAGMVPVARKLRAYFAPVDRVSGNPTVFDPAKHGAFILDAPPSPWIDLGWIENQGRDIRVHDLTSLQQRGSLTL